MSIVTSDALFALGPILSDFINGDAEKITPIKAIEKTARDNAVFLFICIGANVELNGAPLAARPSDRRERF